MGMNRIIGLLDKRAGAINRTRLVRTHRYRIETAHPDEAIGCRANTTPRRNRC